MSYATYTIEYPQEKGMTMEEHLDLYGLAILFALTRGDTTFEEGISAMGYSYGKYHVYSWKIRNHISEKTFYQMLYKEGYLYA